MRYDHDQVAAYVGGLSCRYISERETFHLYWLESRSMGELARHFGITRDAARDRVKRLRRKAKDHRPWPPTSPATTSTRAATPSS